MEFKTLLEQSGMNMKQFGEYFNIPYRTVQDWKNGVSKCPSYLVNLITYKLDHESEHRLSTFLKVLDVDKAIESKKNEIKYLRTTNNLTSEQLDKGFQLFLLEKRLYDKNLAVKEQHAIKDVYHTLCSMLDFDYKASVMVHKTLQILDIYDEVKECNGMLLQYQDDFKTTYIALCSEGSQQYEYTWDSVNEMVQYVDTIEPAIAKNDVVKKWIDTI